MIKTLTPPSKSAAKGFKVGRRAFAKLSAVEGMHLSPVMAKDFDEFDRKGLSADQRRKAIARKYGAVRSQGASTYPAYILAHDKDVMLGLLHRSRRALHPIGIGRHLEQLC